MNEVEVEAHVSALIEDAQTSQIQPAAHIMHMLAGNIQAGNLQSLEDIGEILLEAASRPDRELATHPLADGFGWCPGCGSAEPAVLIDKVCPECQKEKRGRAETPGNQSTAREPERRIK